MVRFAVVDWLRGVAMVLMVVYHVAWDLNYFGLASIPLFGNPFWLGLRAFIPSLFLGLAGASQVLALRGRFRARPFFRRFALIAGCAAAISAGSWLLFPQSWIFFGVLHCVAAGTLLLMVFQRLPVVVVVAGAAFFLLAPEFLAGPVFDTPGLRWIGLMTYFPQTNDYVPLMPWFAATLAGSAVARLVLARQGLAEGIAGLRFDGPVSRVLRLGGRHALLFYMVHQPILFGALWIVAEVA